MRNAVAVGSRERDLDMQYQQRSRPVSACGSTTTTGTSCSRLHKSGSGGIINKKKNHNTECTNTCLHTLTLTLLYSTLLAKCPCSLLWVVSNRGPPPRPIAPHALTSTLLTSYSNLPKSPWLHIRCGWLTPVFLGRLRCVALLPSGNK